MFTVNKNPNANDLRKFGWAMLLGFGVLGILLWILPTIRGTESATLSWTASREQIVALCCWGAGILLWAISMASQAAAKPVYVAWMSVMVPIGLVMSTIMLTLVFIILLPIFSLIVRLGDPLRKRLRREGSYWEDYKPYEPTMDRMARPF